LGSTAVKCAVPENTYTPLCQRKGLEFLRGGGSVRLKYQSLCEERNVDQTRESTGNRGQRPKYLKKCMTLYWNFQGESWKNSLLQGRYGYFLELHSAADVILST